MKVVQGLKLNVFRMVNIPSKSNVFRTMTGSTLEKNIDKVFNSVKVDSVVDCSNVRKTDIEQVRLANRRVPLDSVPAESE